MSIVIARDRPERSVVPLAGAGTFTLERTALERSSLDRTPPVAVAPAAPRTRATAAGSVRSRLRPRLLNPAPRIRSH